MKHSNEIKSAEVYMNGLCVYSNTELNEYNHAKQYRLPSSELDKLLKLLDITFTNKPGRAYPQLIIQSVALKENK
jgi:hypothetical protein